jgi:methylenetetrahydromethanopterin dehydrogenase
MLELLLDEIAAREDLQVTVIGSGAKMTPSETERIAGHVPGLKPDILVISGPNAGAPGMVKIRKLLKDLDAAKVVISDGPSKKVRTKLEEDGYGYLIMEADPLIGARREFLDPTEMAIFNADVIKILAATGSFRAVQEELNQVIEAVKKGETYLPTKVMTESRSLAKAGYSNPYARGKAAAAFQLAVMAAGINYKGCFVEKDMKKYLRLVSSAHEAVRSAAILADEAREIEKASDALLRTPHSKNGKMLKKRSLAHKPKEATR